jgi:putative spermidine/putrescine transport system permease protein
MSRILPSLLIAPALSVVGLFFLLPLGFSIAGAFAGRDGPTLVHFDTAYSLYRTDLLFTLVIIGTSTVLIGLGAVAIGGYLTLGRNQTAVRLLGAMYRWPLFIPFIVAAQAMRGFIGQNGLMNTTLITLGLIPPAWAQSFLDWRGIIITFVWKQLPFAALLVAGAMAALDRSGIEAAQNLGAGRLRILVRIVLPQVARTLSVALILSFVTMMSVLSVPLMISGQSPTMLTVAMAWRITALGDYGTANALGFVACLASGLVAWTWLRRSVREKAR